MNIQICMFLHTNLTHWSLLAPEMELDQPSTFWLDEALCAPLLEHLSDSSVSSLAQVDRQTNAIMARHMRGRWYWVRKLGKYDMHVVADHVDPFLLYKCLSRQQDTWRTTQIIRGITKYLDGSATTVGVGELLLGCSHEGLAYVVETLLRDKRIDLSNKYEGAIIEAASGGGHLDVVKILLEDKRVRSCIPPFAFHIACWRGHTRVVKFLLEEMRFDPSVDDNGAIIAASDGGRVDILMLLLQDKRAQATGGIDPSARDNRAIISASNRHLDVVKLLLQDERVDPSAQDNEAIILASIYKSTNVVEFLLQDKRVDPSAQNNGAIRYASREGYTDVVRLLLQDERVDPRANDNEAIGLACFEGRRNVVALLLQDKKVDPSERDNEAIRLACWRNHEDVVELLLGDERVRAAGFVDPRTMDRGGTALHYRSEYSDVVRFLRDSGRVSTYRSVCTP